MILSSEQVKLGWGRVCGLAFSLFVVAMVGSVGWADSTSAADMDREIQRQEADAAQIVNTLGRGRGVNQNTSSSTDKAFKVEMVRAPGKRKAT
jgi:hypothetical protein